MLVIHKFLLFVTFVVFQVLCNYRRRHINVHHENAEAEVSEPKEKFIIICDVLRFLGREGAAKMLDDPR